jgi:hypothetical protein
MHTPYRRLLFAIASELGVHVHEVELYEREEVFEWLAEFELREEHRKRLMEE